MGIVTLITLSTILATTTKKNNADTSKGQEQMSELANQDAQSIENAIDEGRYQTPADNTDSSSEDISSDTTKDPTEESTQGPTQPPTEPSTEPPTEPSTEPPTEPSTEPPTEPAWADKGFIFSSLTSYVPYQFDAARAKAAADKVINKAGSQAALANTVIVGDSIMYGFDCYSIAYQSNVFAKEGESLKNGLTDDKVAAIIKKKPSAVIIHYGLNEIATAEAQLDSFITLYSSKIQAIKDGLPNAKIIIVQLTPINTKAKNYKHQERFYRIPAYNERMRQMCVELGVGYYENSTLFMEHGDLIASDGYHFSTQMYIYWVKDMVERMGIY